MVKARSPGINPGWMIRSNQGCRLCRHVCLSGEEVLTESHPQSRRPLETTNRAIGFWSCFFQHNPDEDKAIYMKTLPGFSQEKSQVWKLKKTLYGLKQSAHKWQKTLTELLLSIGYVQSSADDCVFLTDDQHLPPILFVHVDDMMIVCQECTDLSNLQEFISA